MGAFHAHDPCIDAQRQACALSHRRSRGNPRDAPRSADEKKRFYERLVTNLQADPGVDPADVLINIIEVTTENWSPSNGIAGLNAVISSPVAPVAPGPPAQIG
ncbi:tautomerase family protein [Trinickia terrae]|uniref:tautomerase family protein n=1 Tax=Trinickia terrae TaxID=2571161 RepID=UPI0034E275C3